MDSILYLTLTWTWRNAMHFLSQFSVVTLVGILAVVSPGPDFIIVTRNSLVYSKKVGLFTALGITVGTMTWIALSLLGISYLISEAVVLFNIIKWVGAIYLIYLGLKSLFSKADKVSDRENEAVERRSDLTPARAFSIGLLTNFLNPKAALFFVSFFSVILTPDTPLVWQIFYGAEISLIALSWFSLLATVLSIKRVKAQFQQIRVWVDRVTGLILAGLGIKLLLSEAKW